MEVISIIVMFIFGNMNDQEHRMTQYVPMESLSSCMKEVRILKKKETPEGSTLSLDKKKITKESMEKWTLKSKEKWESNK